MASESAERFKELRNDSLHVQKKTFTNWINSYMKKVNLEVKDLFKDLSDGEILLKLLQTLSGEKIGRINAGKTRFHKIENVNRCLSFLNSKVRLEGIGAEDVVGGNPRLVMGLLWTIIINFQIGDVFDTSSVDEDKPRFVRTHRTAKEALLLWCQQRTSGYPGVKVRDFGASWRDGLAFCALIHSERRDAVKFELLDRTNRLDNLKKAFAIAEDKLAIPKLLDAEDVDVDRPDEISIMTYLSQFYHAFNKSESSGRILGAVDPHHPVVEIVEKPVVRAEVEAKPVVTVVPPIPARRQRLASRDGQTVVKSPDGDRSSWSSWSSVGVSNGGSNIGTSPNKEVDHAWACNHCPSVNLSTRTFCGSCFNRRDRPASGKDNEATAMLRRTKADLLSTSRFTGASYYVPEEKATKRPAKTAEEEKVEEEKKRTADENRLQPVSKSEAARTATLEARVEKLEMEMERMKKKYYVDLGEAKSRSVALEEEVQALRELVREQGLGWESNKSKMARVERMLLNIASQKRTW